MKNKPLKPTKRVLLTVTAESYDRLQKNIKLAGLPKYYFSRELDKVIQALDQVILQLIEAKAKNQDIKEKQVMELVIKAAETAQGMKIKNIEFEDAKE